MKLEGQKVYEIACGNCERLYVEKLNRKISVIVISD